MSESRRFLATSADVADTVRGERTARGWTQAELAVRAGVGRKFVLDLEAGHPRAELDKVLAVLEALDVHALALPSVPRDQRGPVDLDEMLGQYGA